MDKRYAPGLNSEAPVQPATITGGDPVLSDVTNLKKSLEQSGQSQNFPN